MVYAETADVIAVSRAVLIAFLDSTSIFLLLYSTSTIYNAELEPARFLAAETLRSETHPLLPPLTNHNFRLLSVVLFFNFFVICTYVYYSYFSQFKNEKNVTNRKKIENYWINTILLLQYIIDRLILIL